MEHLNTKYVRKILENKNKKQNENLFEMLMNMLAKRKFFPPIHWSYLMLDEIPQPLHYLFVMLS